MKATCLEAIYKLLRAANDSRVRLFVSMLAVAVLAITPVAAAEIEGAPIFNRIVAKATKERWRNLPMPQLMWRVAMELRGTPYVAGTLDTSVDKETPSVRFDGLDCVTFFETTLGTARMMRKGGGTPADLLSEITYTRYRGGIAGDYTSRLHYTSDWFYDNQSKKVVSILPGLLPFPQPVNFMTTHTDAYPALKAHPEFIPKMKKIEQAINLHNKSIKFVPLNALASYETKLRTGDIVGIVTNIPGLDISHTGIVVVDENKVPHFMDASSKSGVNKVLIEPERLSASIRAHKNAVGAIFARPLDPVTKSDTAKKPRRP